jgi:hypothetical protein
MIRRKLVFHNNNNNNEAFNDASRDVLHFWFGAWSEINKIIKQSGFIFTQKKLSPAATIQPSGQGARKPTTDHHTAGVASS